MARFTREKGAGNRTASRGFLLTGLWSFIACCRCAGARAGSVPGLHPRTVGNWVAASDQGSCHLFRNTSHLARLVWIINQVETNQ